jgi:hypothetical protein
VKLEQLLVRAVPGGRDLQQGSVRGRSGLRARLQGCFRQGLHDLQLSKFGFTPAPAATAAGNDTDTCCFAVAPTVMGHGLSHCLLCRQPRAQAEVNSSMENSLDTCRYGK